MELFLNRIKPPWCCALALLLSLPLFLSGCAQVSPFADGSHERDGDLSEPPPRLPGMSKKAGGLSPAYTIRGQNASPPSYGVGPSGNLPGVVGVPTPGATHTVFQPPTQGTSLDRPETSIPGPNGFIQPYVEDPGLGGEFVQTAPPVPFDIYVQEAQTGRFMFGAGINSDAGLTGQVVVDERNFDLFRPPRSWSDVVEGRAFRGGGQGFRVEAMPGEFVQRYVASFTEPYLFSTPISLNLSGALYDRMYEDWDERRLGGRLAFGYRLTPDISVSLGLTGDNVKISDPRVVGVPDLDAAVGEHGLYGSQVTLTHDTRDMPFMATEGHYLQTGFKQTFGSFSYPRVDVDYRRYFLIRERADGSGRHTLSTSFRGGYTGSQTPIFENYFAGGHSTIRGFDFRGASPVVGGVTVGGELSLLASVEYLFPLTADDMLRGVVFVDFGTVEETTSIYSDNVRVSPGLGLRISIPAMGPAPLALDFAFPVAKADFDDTQVFSFFFGFGR